MNEPGSFEMEPFFLPFGEGALFCMFIVPAQRKPRAAVLYFPPFAEEMHKSRRMAALQARSFAEAGYAVLQFDLLGCGDSTGHFQDADWGTWLSCGRAAHDWLRGKLGGETPIVFWGLRLGAALAVELSAKQPAAPEIAGLILWQPVTNGESFLNQFLRIRVASEMLAPQQEKIGVKELRRMLDGTGAVEVGGYMLSSRLALAVDKIRLAQLPIRAQTWWLEISSAAPPDSPSPASLKVVEAWRGANIKVRAQTVPGEPFWATQEIAECPGLLAKTLEALEDIAP